MRSSQTVRVAALTALACVTGWLLSAGPAVAQSRDVKVRTDREKLVDDDSWVYDDLEIAREIARQQNKPLLVVLRCIP